MITLQFQYKPFFQVDFEHNFFENTMLRNLTIKPSPDTLKLIQSLGMLFKLSDSGFVILSDTCKNEGIRMSLEALKDELVTFRFLIYINDPFFFNYTNIPNNNNETIFCFSNEKLENKPTGKLHKADYVSESEQYDLNADLPLQKICNSIDPTTKGSPIGVVDLQLTPKLLEHTLSRLVDSELPTFTYSIKFDSRSVHWKYVIIPSYSKKLNNLMVASHKDTKTTFTTAQKAEISNKQVLTFTSKQAIKLQQYYKHTFQLKRDTEGSSSKTIIKQLQYASFEKLKPLEDKNNTNYCSEIYVYI